MDKIKIAFVCVHNSCRSQMAEAISKKFFSDIFDAYSAGTELKPQINQDAVRIIKDLYDIDMNKCQKSKLLSDIPKVDIIIKMGCNVVCPVVSAKYVEDFGLDDPTGKNDEEFIKTAKIIKEKIEFLVEKIKDKRINIDLI
ncbi:MAG: arsenate reductase ArsC [Paraclostridium sp.]|uniref:arsenate reductase/protein-tyrosine-phosphatase family protein n=1 Tax=Paraclostridium sp. TaxID=2023273 RepID=UPI003F29F902